MDLALQGNLFGEPEPSDGGRTSAKASDSQVTLGETGDPTLDDAALTADAQARPRQRDGGSTRVMSRFSNVPLALPLAGAASSWSQSATLRPLRMSSAQ